MKTTPNPTRAALPADPRIVKKTQRDNAAHASFGGLFREQDQDYVHQPDYRLQAPRLLEFGRPGL